MSAPVSASAAVPNPAPAALVRLEHVRFGYAARPLLFADMSFALHAGERIGLYAPNGSGKTSLLRLLTGLEQPSGGQLYYKEKPVQSAEELHALRCSLGCVLQNADDQLFCSTVLEDVAFGPLNLGLDRDAAREQALAALQAVGMTDFADRPVHELSGGEKKLAAIASVLSMQPDALLLDEPTTFLDARSRTRITDLVRQQERALLVISHDTDFLRNTVSQLLTIQDRQLVPCTL